MSNENGEVIGNATTALRESLTALEAEETRLTGELTTVKNQRKALQKAVEMLDPNAKPKRGRGRPRKTPDAAAVA